MEVKKLGEAIECINESCNGYRFTPNQEAIAEVNKAAKAYHEIKPLLDEMVEVKKKYNDNGSCYGDDLMDYLRITVDISEIMNGVKK